MKSDSAPWWTQTYSPLVGCSRCSTGCLHCWAERFARRHAANATFVPATRRAYQDVAAWDGTIRLLPHMLGTPHTWRKPRVVLTCAMTDLFHPNVASDAWRQVWAVMAVLNRHQFCVPTKRPEHVLRILDHKTHDKLVDGIWKNIWLGASICNQADADRMLPPLCELARRGWNTFFHCEPLVGDFRLNTVHDRWWADGQHPRWIVAGGESGPGARMTDPAWMRTVLYHAEARGIRFWFKGWGAHVPPGQQPGKLDGKTWRQRPQELTT